MKNINLLAAAGLALCLASPAVASSLPQAVDGTVSVAGHSADPGLVVNTTNGSFSGSLNAVGDSFNVANLFTISTNESSVNLGEDTKRYDITATFTFANPVGATGNPITGETFGFIHWNPLNGCGILTGGCGVLEWNGGGTETFSFGNIGRLQVTLDNTVFGTNGVPANVGGTFTLLAAVPEPSTWAMMILGFGAVGFMMRSRRRENVSVPYA